VYEAKGLLPATERTTAGYRLYNQDDVELLTFIRRARTLGLHLDDIREVLVIRDGGTPPCATVRDLLDARIAEIDATIAELLALRKTLAPKPASEQTTAPTTSLTAARSSRTPSSESGRNPVNPLVIGRTAGRG